MFVTQFRWARIYEIHYNSIEKVITVSFFLRLVIKVVIISLLPDNKHLSSRSISWTLVNKNRIQQSWKYASKYKCKTLMWHAKSAAIWCNQIHMHMQCLECSASTSNKPFSVCHNVSGDTVVPQLLRYHAFPYMMSTVSLAQRCMSQVLAVHVCGAWSYVVQQVHLPGWLGVFCLFGLQCMWCFWLS